jgi:regulatory protein
MQKVTRLERQKRNKNRVNVYLDGEFAFGLNEMDAAKLSTGQQLSPSEVATLRESDAISKAFDKAVNLLSYRPRSKEEIRRRLAKKDYSEHAIAVAIERLERMGYLDDRAFATFWIENRNRHKPRGKRALRYELRRKGISDRIIRELLDEMVDEKEGAYEAAQSRLRRMRGATEYEFKRKVGGFLQRRGFSYDAVNRALDRHINEINEREPGYFAEPDGDEWHR